MKAVFVELPAFTDHRDEYLSDEEFTALQSEMMKNPEAGDVIKGTGGLRKLRFGDPARGKGKRGGLRVIYFWWDGGSQFWLFTLYNKDEMSDLNDKQKAALKKMLTKELEARNGKAKPI
ncbi:MAG TPA: type II toxin-antitoxin system RelE/ParE family toxin [Variovorax sp.]